MRFFAFFTIFCSFRITATIKNSQAPICQNCVHYQANLAPSLSKCSHFGNKNIITGEIKYDYADLSRMDENSCGLEGKYYNETPPYVKALQYAFMYQVPTKALTVFFFLWIWANTME